MLWLVWPGAMLIGRGIPSEQSMPGTARHPFQSGSNTSCNVSNPSTHLPPTNDAASHAVITQYVKSLGGAQRFACPADAHNAVYLRTSSNKLDLGPNSVRPGNASAVPTSSNNSAYSDSS